ncbi:hypothetical protein B0H14DRAFT_3881276 [Mycena olivaceomarginata]|nr:hypothetical protein B0H14DRAFT_3881276 [Mycena olivaceomarginata]
MYDGKRVSAVSPAFADVRKIRDCIAAHRKVEFPAGTGFSGVQHYMQTKDHTLPVSERYIHAAMSKGRFKLVVTLHPQLAKFIHSVLALAIGYTFKHIECDMDEWEVVGFSERFKCRLPFASFYCDRKTKPAFEQLFIELFDAVYRVTGDKLQFSHRMPPLQQCAGVGGNLLKRMTLLRAFGGAHSPSGRGQYLTSAASLSTCAAAIVR